MDKAGREGGGKEREEREREGLVPQKHGRDPGPGCYKRLWALWGIIIEIRTAGDEIGSSKIIQLEMTQGTSSKEGKDRVKEKRGEGGGEKFVGATKRGGRGTPKRAGTHRQVHSSPPAARPPRLGSAACERWTKERADWPK